MDSETILLRQIHPTFVQADNVSVQAFSVTSQAFKPTPKDEGKLSVYNSEKFTPESSYNHFTSGEFKSSGVLGVSKAECNAEELNCIEDNNPFDGHTYIDFTALSGNQIEKKAKKLRNAALTRGWLYREMQG
ncbi:hypothetical protein ACTHGU_17075 [Chitinophagaceae bacterium MMS25-I14]